MNRFPMYPPAWGGVERERGKQELLPKLTVGYF